MIETRPTLYEKSQINLIQEWIKSEPGIIKRTLGLFAKPFVWLARTIVPDSAIRGALSVSKALAGKMAKPEDILKKARKEKETPNCLADLQKINLEVCDDLASSVHSWAKMIAGVEGGVTGLLGLPGLAVDVPSIITFAIRTVIKIGYCYGFDLRIDKEEIFVLQILSAAGANSMAEKTESVAALKMIYATLQKMTWKKINEKAAANVMSKEGFIVAVRNLTKQLGINLTKRKAMQIVPIVGAGVGTAVNVDFINDVAWTARRIIQRRWLETNCIEIQD